MIHPRKTHKVKPINEFNLTDAICDLEKKIEKLQRQMNYEMNRKEGYERYVMMNTIERRQRDIKEKIEKAKELIRELKAVAA